MARTGAVFGGEHSAHYYFRDFWNADTGMLAALHVLAALGAQDGPLSALVADYDRYAASGEINSTVADQAGRTAAVRAAFAGRDGVTFDELDGLTVTRRRLVVQPARLQHRAAAAAQRRGPRRGHRRPDPRPGPRHRPRLTAEGSGPRRPARPAGDSGARLTPGGP